LNEYYIRRKKVSCHKNITNNEYTYMYQNSFFHICTQCCDCDFVIIIIVIKNKWHYECLTGIPAKREYDKCKRFIVVAKYDTTKLHHIRIIWVKGTEPIEHTLSSLANIHLFLGSSTPINICQQIGHLFLGSSCMSFKKGQLCFYPCAKV
jgi:hypothetical protein